MNYAAALSVKPKMVSVETQTDLSDVPKPGVEKLPPSAVTAKVTVQKSSKQSNTKESNSKNLGPGKKKETSRLPKYQQKVDQMEVTELIVGVEESDSSDAECSSTHTKNVTKGPGKRSSPPKSTK
jgi:hypothetical protein